MTAQLTQRSDSFVMMNFEITFKGLQAWLALAGQPMDDATLFRILFSSDFLLQVEQAEILRMIVYRYEDAYFQAFRNEFNEEVNDQGEPIHQLLLAMMNQRLLKGEEDALLDFYLILQEDIHRDMPLYPSLHQFFDRTSHL